MKTALWVFAIVSSLAASARSGQPEAGLFEKPREATFGSKAATYER